MAKGEPLADRHGSNAEIHLRQGRVILGNLAALAGVGPPGPPAAGVGRPAAPLRNPQPLGQVDAGLAAAIEPR